MRQIYATGRLMLFILLVCFKQEDLNAQNFSLAQDTVFLNVGNSGSINLHHTVITSQSSIGIQWTVIAHNLPTPFFDTEVSLCDNNLCYGSSVFDLLVGSVQTTAINSGSPMDLKLTLNPGNSNGTYYVVVEIKDDGNATTRQATYVINRFPTSVNDVSEIGIVLYPNPANDRLSIQVDQELNARSLRLYNLRGELIAAHPVNGRGKETIDVSHIASGVYFAYLVDANGQVVVIKRLIKE